ncbi:TIGR03943 family protein [Metabacillus sp. FJAT-52054]|uniref:TIGR03943 family protein n=1 Tax=Metabacillus sediminis TaxID=3117746 RepID=A0ABZ2NE43_9BACI
MEEPDYRYHLFIRGIILTGFSMLIFKLILTGNIQNFIAPRMVPFMYFASVSFLILGFVQMWRSGSKKQEEVVCDCGFDHGNKKIPVLSIAVYLVFIFPIVTGFMFPKVILDSSVAEKRGFKSGTALAASDDPGEKRANGTSRAEEYLENPEEYMKKLDERTKGSDETDKVMEEMAKENPDGVIVEDEVIEKAYNKMEKQMKEKDKLIFTDDHFIKMTNIMDENPGYFEGKKVEIIGFVYREPGFTDEQLAISRFGISCCVADANVYGTIAEHKGAKKFNKDQWVKAEGVLSKNEFNGKQLPVIKITKIVSIKQPENPYVYESY